MDEADNAQKEVATRKLTYDVVTVPGFETDDTDDGFDYSDQHAHKDGNIIPLPNTMSSHSVLSVASGHCKVDSGFSFADSACGDQGGNMMLQYLMELQDNLKTAKKDMLDLHTSIIHSNRSHYYMRESMHDIEFSDKDDDDDISDSFESNEGSDMNDTNDTNEKDKILKRNLRTKKKRSSCFSCFTGGDSDSEEGNSDVTALLMEKY
eukprot:UN11905